MDILFSSGRLKKQFSSWKTMLKVWGAKRAKILNRRLDQLRAAESLETLRNLPGRCHELSGDRKGQLSLDLDGPYRLLFEPAHNPIPTKDDGGMDWSRIEAVRILEVKDTHG